MGRKITIGFIMLVVVGGGWFFFASQNAQAPTENTEVTNGKTWIVEFSDGAYIPKMLDVKKGDMVTWVNKSNSATWPASAIHPTHGVYPNSGIEKCSTSAQAQIFDACKGLKNGESWSFQFSEVGSWRYHDHLNANIGGVVNVSE